MLALHRIQNRRAHTKATEITFLNVAEEAGVSAALIHNSYATTVGVAIREAQGRSWKQLRDEMRQEIKELKAQARELQKELKLVKEQRRKLATLNEVLTRENELLRAVQAVNVTTLRR